MQKKDKEKRENNLVLFTAPENGKQNAQERQNEDEGKFTSFWINGFQLHADLLPKTDKIVRLGKPCTNPNDRPQQTKVVLENRDKQKWRSF